MYDAAGGREGLLALAHAWHVRCLADPVVSHAFSHGYREDHSERLAAYWAEALGGPTEFTDTMADESHVLRLHSGNGPHEEMDRRALEAFVLALDDAGVPDSEPTCCTARLRSLALVDVVALAPWGSDYFRLVGEHPDVFAALPPPFTRVRCVPTSPAPATSVSRPRLSTGWSHPGWARKVRQRSTGRSRRPTSATPTSSPSCSPRMDLPVLVVWGRDDTWIPVDRAAPARRLIPGARLRIIDGAGHLVQLDQPAALAVTLTEWLRGRGQGTST